MGVEPFGVIATDEPAVQTEVSITLDYDTYINCIKIPFIADSNVADRDIDIEISIGSDVIFASHTNTSITADETRTIFIIAGTEVYQSGDYEYESLPMDFKIPRGATITTSTDNFQVGDQFGKIIVFGKT